MKNKKNDIIINDKDLIIKPLDVKPEDLKIDIKVEDLKIELNDYNIKFEKEK